MSNDTLHYSNNLLLMTNNSLALCCCDNEAYWEAIPCDLTLNYRTGLCAEWDQCQFINRKYVSNISRCRGTASTVCECQALTFTNYSTGVSGLLKFGYNGAISSGIPFNSNKTLYAAAIELELQSMIGDGITVTYNPAYGGWRSDIERFEITFGGALCGISQKEISINNNDIQPVGVTAAITYGAYVSGYGGYLADPNYFQIGSSGIRTCPYEDITWSGGPAWYDSNIQCCPQKGTTIGPRQTVGLEALAGYNISGYCYGGCTTISPYNLKSFANLERTVILGTGCFQLSPYYFLFGKEGRFEYDYYNDQQLFVASECKYDISGSCIDQIPCDCNPQLFIAQFHKDVPWGVFGSYYQGIENDTHKAYTFPWNTPYSPAGAESFLYLNVAGGYGLDRIGFDYRPQGTIKTVGTWQETKQIQIRACIKRPIPFYVGSGDWDDINYYVELDSATVSGITSAYEGSAGCGCFSLTFDTSGKTVGDFLDAVNRITAKDYGCSLFAFCPASTEARSIPASKIINTSAELFEQKVIGGVPGDDGPEVDADLYSGSEILVGPKRYQDTFKNNPDNPFATDIGTYNDVPLSATLDETILKTPPICRLSAHRLPKLNQELASDVRESTNCWWTAMQGCRDTVISVGPGTGYLDPFTSLTVNVTSGIITVSASGSVSGVPFMSTGIVNTLSSGTYTALNCIDSLNSLSFTRHVGTGTYNPVFATSGQIFDVWLNDNTFDLASSPAYGTGTVATTYNYSYKEPLINTSGNISILTSSGNLESWIRRRCNWYIDGVTQHDLDLPYCVPPSTVVESNDVNCAGDRIIDNGWVISQGCSSYVCKTRYYIPASRCPCEKVYRCKGSTGDNMPHPFNQLRKKNNPTWQLVNSEADYYVTQPTLYVCELNFHPDCDIPMMVKVPFQIVNMADETDIVYQDGSSPLLPGYCEFCGGFSDSCPQGPRYSNFFGWCQYLDPLGARVREEDIPRETPAISYIAERSTGTFCSVNPWNFDPQHVVEGTIGVVVGPGSMIGNLPQGCANPGDPNSVDCASISTAYPCPGCDQWDSIQNIHPVFALGPDETISLTALTRPILNDLNEDDVCTAGVACNRLDIDCSTVCCECFYVCDSSNGGCRDILKHDPYTQTTTYDLDVDITGEPGHCEFTRGSGPGCYDFMGDCVCLYPINLPPGVLRCQVPSCFNGTVDRTSSVHMTKTQTTCGCSIDAPCSVETITISITCPPGGGECGGSGCYSWTVPTLAALNPTCYTCDNFPGVTVSNICCTGSDCDCTSILDRGTIGCDQVAGGIPCYNTYSDELSRSCGSGSVDSCGVGAYHNESLYKHIAQGTSCKDSSSLGWVGTSCTDPYTFTTVITRVEDTVINAPNWTSCSTAGSQIGQNYYHILGWLDSIQFVCGLQNIIYASGIETADGRFKGSTGC